MGETTIAHNSQNSTDIFINQPHPQRVMDVVEETRKQKVKRFIKETIRVLRITKKPSKEEYISIVKVTGVGIAVLGTLGLVVFLGKQLLF